ncbi:hypothetical protein ACLMJK_006383 [Lecanora helva]
MAESRTPKKQPGYARPTISSQLKKSPAVKYERKQDYNILHPAEERYRLWRQRASYLDIIRGTRLGTLGYLPREIREQIWETFFVFTFTYLPRQPRISLPEPEPLAQRRLARDLPCEPQVFLCGNHHSDPFSLWGDERRFGAPGSGSNLYYLNEVEIRSSQPTRIPFSRDARNRPLWFALGRRNLGLPAMWAFSRHHWWTALGLQAASETVHEEMDFVFFSRHEFTFKTCFDLLHFCRIMPPDRLECLRRVVIWLRGQHWSYDLGGNCINGYERTIELWQETIRCLPENLNTVLLRMGGECMNRMELDALGVIVQNIRQVAKRAVITICRDGDMGLLSDEKLAMYRSVVDEALRCSEDVKNEEA